MKAPGRFLLLSTLLLSSVASCSYARPGPKNPALACEPGAPPPPSRNGPGFPCWPPGLSPDESALHLENELFIPAPPAATWAWLARPELWPSWFPEAKDVHVEGASPLRPGSVVTWEMIGATIRVEVTRADAPHVLAWEGGGRGVHAYHAWLLLPERGGTRVLTVETETGPVAGLFGWAYVGKLRDAHDEWLAGLGRVAASGLPPQPHLPPM